MTSAPVQAPVADVELRWHEAAHLDALTGSTLLDLIPPPPSVLNEPAAISLARTIGARRLIRRGIVTLDQEPVVDPVLLVMLDLMSSPAWQVELSRNGRVHCRIAVGDGLSLTARAHPGSTLTLRPGSTEDVPATVAAAMSLDTVTRPSRSAPKDPVLHEVAASDTVEEHRLWWFRDAADRCWIVPEDLAVGWLAGKPTVERGSAVPVEALVLGQRAHAVLAAVRGDAPGGVEPVTPDEVAP